VLDRAALWIYGSVFCAIIGTGLGAPFPEELPIVAAGIACGHKADSVDFPAENRAVLLLAANPTLPFPASIPWGALYEPEPGPAVPLKWYLMLPLCILGVVIGDGFLYGLGRIFGVRLLDSKWVKRVLPQAKREEIEGNFHRYGMWVLLSARLLPTIRAPIYMMAGVMRLPFSLFVLADGIYAIPGVSLLFFLGYWFGNQVMHLVESFEGKVAAAKPIIFLLLLTLVTVYLIWHFFRHPVATGDPEQEVPVIGEKMAAKITYEHEQSSEGPAKSPSPNGSADAKRHSSTDPTNEMQ
jgi:membrane protein DedA with SNARE-associated domain